MRIIFCNITYLRFYDGREIGELKPKKGGRWVRENEDAHEKWNFLNMDGMCYGYVQGNSEQMHIETIDKAFKNQDVGEDITVVWCAQTDDDKSVIVGWYEHATAHRYMQDMFTTPVSGVDRYYWFYTEANNAYLLPEEERVFEIGRAAKTGIGTGFGRQNYWFAGSEYARENIIPAVMKFIEDNRHKRINTLDSAFNQPENLNPLTEEEFDYVESLSDSENMEYLPYGYRIYANDPNANNAFCLGMALKDLFQYKKATEWFEKVLELEPDDSDAMGVLAYLYNQCGEYEKALPIVARFLNHPIMSDPAAKDEIYCLVTDIYFFMGETEEAIFWQDKIIKESKDKELVEYTKNLQTKWKEML